MPGKVTLTKYASSSSTTTKATTSTPPSSTSPPETRVTTPLSSQRRDQKASIQTPTRNLFKTIVTINVGPEGSERQAFQVHRELLEDTSPFFKAAFDGNFNFSESASGVLAFPDIRAIDFEYLVQWLYRQSLAHEELDVPRPAYFKLIRLYILADFLHIEALKNDIIDMIISVCEKHNSVPTPEDTILIEDHVREKTALRMLIVDLFVYKKTDRIVEKHGDSW